MTLRTNNHILSIQELGGVNDLVDEVKLPPEYVGESSGGYYNVRHELERRGGSLAVTSAATGGPVWTLRTLEFADRRLVLSHTSSRYELWSSSSMACLLTGSTTASPEVIV